MTFYKLKQTLLCLLILLVLLPACSSQSVLLRPSSSLKQLGDTVRLSLSGEQIEPAVLEQLQREIKAQLILAGFEPTKTDASRLNLNVIVTAFNPGNAALRMTVGFGAGRGSLLYQANYSGEDGKILAKLDGEERFTGLELDYNQHYGLTTTMGGAETATMVLIKEAAKHIVELAINPVPQDDR